MNRLKYNGNLIYGATVQDDPKCWHIADNPTAAGDFSVCGVAHDEIEDVSGYDFGEMPLKNGGICTCEECIRQLFEWKKIIAKAPGLKGGKS